VHCRGYKLAGHTRRRAVQLPPAREVVRPRMCFKPVLTRTWFTMFWCSTLRIYGIDAEATGEDETALDAAVGKTIIELQSARWVRCVRERGLSIEAQSCRRFQRLASQPSRAKVACDVELATAGRPSDWAVLRLQIGGVFTNTPRQEVYSQTPAVKFRASHRLRGKGRISACRGRTIVGLLLTSSHHLPPFSGETKNG
jgi:hypothetical protein